MRAHLSKLEAKLEALLQHVSEELATEVGREQNHLMLMQDQARPDLLMQHLLHVLLFHSTIEKQLGPCLFNLSADDAGPSAVPAFPHTWAQRVVNKRSINMRV